MWDQLNDWERIGACVMLLSAFVDIFQFSWILQKGYQNAKKKLYDRIRKEILLDQLNKKDE